MKKSKRGQQEVPTVCWRIRRELLIFSGPLRPIKVLCDNQAQDVGQFLQEEQGFKIITQSLKKEKNKDRAAALI